MENVGDSVKRRRLALGMDRKALAAEAGVDRGTLTRLETEPGYRHRIKPATLRAVLSTLERIEEEAGVSELEQSLVTVTLDIPGGGRAIMKGSADDIRGIMSDLMRGYLPPELAEQNGP